MFLTDSWARRAKREGDGFCWDDELPGFGLRVYPSGRKSFVFRHYEGERRRIRVIGPFPGISVDEARRTARELFLRHNEHARRIARRRLFRELAADYLTTYAQPRKRSWKADEYLLDRHILPEFGAVEARSILRIDVERFFARLSMRTPVTANRVLSLLKKIFALAIEWGDVEENPAEKVKKTRERSRDTYVEQTELPKLLSAIDADPSAPFRVAVYLLLMTGLRKSELLTLEWKNVFPWRRAIVIEQTKNGDPLTLPLSDKAFEMLITELPCKGRYVFDNNGKPLKDFRRRWHRVRLRAGLSHIRVHDLRRTVGSQLAQMGYSLHLIGGVLNHKDPRSTSIYSRFHIEHLRSALEAQNSAVLSARSTPVLVASAEPPLDHIEPSAPLACAKPAPSPLSAISKELSV